MKFRPLVTQWLAAKLAIALVARAKSAKILYRTWSDAPEQSQHDLAAVMRFVLDLNVKIDSVGNFGQLSAMLHFFKYKFMHAQARRQAAYRTI